jgi:branched-subunit amino acid transport protein
MFDTDWATVASIAGLTAITVLTRSLFFISDKEWGLPDWVQRGLRYAPIAALTAVIAPEVLMSQGHLTATWQDARLFGVAAGAAWFFWRRGVLGTIVCGMVVYLPLHVGLGW